MNVLCIFTDREKMILNGVTKYVFDPKDECFIVEMREEPGGIPFNAFIPFANVKYLSKMTSLEEKIHG